MQTLGKLKKVVAAFFERTEADLTVLGEDLFLNAANNARRDAELLHNFEYARITATLSIDSVNGASLLDAVIQGSADEAVKEIKAIVRYGANGRVYPLPFTSADIPIEETRQALDLDVDMRPGVRYPSDAQWEARQDEATIIQRGQNLYIYPPGMLTDSALNVTIEGYGWLPDYEAADLVASTPKDFMVQYGSTYLQWAVINELNFLFRQWVPRQEGNLAPPEKAQDSAWAKLLLWDDHMVNANISDH